MSQDGASVKHLFNLLQYNRAGIVNFTTIFRVDDIVFTGNFGKSQKVYNCDKGMLIKSFDIIDLVTLWLDF